MAEVKNERPWFKCFAKFWIDDVAIRRLPSDYALIYHQLYCLCALDGEGAYIVGDVDDIAWRLHRSSEFTTKALDALAELSLVEISPGTVCLLRWDQEQPEITEADRQKAYRTRKNQGTRALS